MKFRLGRRIIINTVAFIVLASLLFILLAIRILPTVFGDTYKVYGDFQAAGGVFTNQEVTYRGVQVGRVGEMTLTPEAVRIEMKIENKFKIPRTDTHARILYKSAVGEQFIDLLPTSEGAPYFQEGDEIPMERTSIPIQTEDLLRNLNSVLESLSPKALGSVVHELGQGLRGHGPDLKQLLLAIDTLAAIGASHQAEIATGLRAGAGLQDAFNKTREDFVEASGSLADLAEILAERRNDLAATLDSTKVLDGQILRLLRNRESEIESMVSNIGTITRISQKQLSDLDLTLQFLGPFLGRVYDAYAAPYFIFNLVTNSDGQGCIYSPSSRPSGNPRPITEADTPQNTHEPNVTFKCAGASSASAGEPSAPASSAVQTQLPARLSWLRLYLKGIL